VEQHVDGSADMGRLSDVVRRAPLFAALDEDAAAELLASMEPAHVERGEELFAEGDAGDRVYVVLSGKIKLVRGWPDGRENLLAVLGPGELFGELSVFDPGPRTSSARAVSEADLIALGHEDMMRWLGRRPEVAQHLLRALAQRLRRTNTTLADLVFTDVPGRVAKALLDLSSRFGRPIADGVLVAHDLTQEELAQLVGASRETVNKALADFASRGWLRLEARAVVLHDLERLEKRAR
jgi:CRP/FNR family cyclic AMP-dependent transcriptional regulator